MILSFRFTAQRSIAGRLVRRCYNGCAKQRSA
jgi:hypothetical protein